MAQTDEFGPPSLGTSIPGFQSKNTGPVQAPAYSMAPMSFAKTFTTRACALEREDRQSTRPTAVSVPPPFLCSADAPVRTVGMNVDTADIGRRRGHSPISTGVETLERERERERLISLQLSPGN